MKTEGKGEIYKREPRDYKEFPIVGREKETIHATGGASRHGDTGQERATESV